MSFNQFTNRSQNYGNTKAPGRDQIIANSRAKRQERQKTKKRQNAAQTIQKWFRMKRAYNQTTTECKEMFDDQITAILQSQRNNNSNKSNESALNFVYFNRLLRLFRIAIVGFNHNTKQWKISKKYASKQKKCENESKWF